MILDIVDQHVDVLKQAYPRTRHQRRNDGSVLVEISEFPLPPGWNAGTTTVSFVVPLGYPQARPDSFWTDPSLRLKHEGMPANSGLNTNYGGPDPRLWFSYHPERWDPNRDSLWTYLKLIRRRFEDPR